MCLEATAPRLGSGTKHSLAKFSPTCVSLSLPPSAGPWAVRLHLSSGHRPGRASRGWLGPPATFQIPRFEVAAGLQVKLLAGLSIIHPQRPPASLSALLLSSVLWAKEPLLSHQGSFQPRPAGIPQGCPLRSPLFLLTALGTIASGNLAGVTKLTTGRRGWDR